MNAGYLILAKWITGVPLSDVVHCHYIGGNNEKSNTAVGLSLGDDGKTAGEIGAKTSASTLDIGSAVTQLREKYAELGGEEILQYLLREIQKWEVSEL